MDEIGDNISSYSAPDNGDLVVFYLKKDGSIGKKFENISGNNETHFNYTSKLWLPEGKDKNQQ